MAALLALPEGGEWIVILVIVVLLFGSKKLPELTRNAARAMNEFKKVNSGEDDEKPQVDGKAAQPASGDLQSRPAESASEQRPGV
ncbi:sec-independent protein translocase protein TatA [Kribbella antiqua]|uniref:Sec-independent protein translocase protein TatA n=1 Tax=Kribbella antiqua TaxID=2512217 RepID=A0A4R2IP04_9ACTN|nr:twin-arginine translocase TatA/TatE family subunit [Kribbella antiqua]TCO46903.1 sec-independent protein translocase protein TatA [Kribbella antiqua]